ncbi:MAG: pre-peptidase C-terminal domain-containing protein [Microcoleus sp. CAN_BIN18]|nr:pre-peptidase C-terminal domain-containing protein [Microcoleus sp. CAN_BIN18]
MRQVSRFWAIAPIALLATFWAKPTVSSPVSDAVRVSNSRSSTLILKSPAVLAQESPKPSPSPQQSPTQSPTPAPIPTKGPSKVILEQKGELSPAKSSVLPSDSSLFDEYTFEGTQGQKVIVTVESTEFDTYVAILNSQGELVGENDDATQQNSNSELTVTLSASGRYRVIVNALEPPPKGKGKYSLTVRESTGN